MITANISFIVPGIEDLRKTEYVSSISSIQRSGAVVVSHTQLDKQWLTAYQAV
jgi:hypothetical protein